MASCHPKDKKCATCRYWTGNRRYIRSGSGGLEYDSKENAKCSHKQNQLRPRGGNECCWCYEAQY